MSVLRQRVHEQFKLSSELDAFYLGHFPEIIDRLSDGMDRTARVNMLFVMAQLSEIEQCLNEHLHERPCARLPSLVSTSERQTGLPDGLRHRVGEACRMREQRRQDPTAKHPVSVEWAPASPPVQWLGVVAYFAYKQTIRHGLAVTTTLLTYDFLDELCLNLEKQHLRTGSTMPTELIYAGPRPSADVAQAAAQRNISLYSLDEYEGLIDLTTHVTRQTKRLSEDKVYPPSLYIPQYMECCEGASMRFDPAKEEPALEQLLAWIHDPGRPRLVVLLGDSGLGKTFLFREACRRLGQAAANGAVLIPLYLEMRNLEKAHDLPVLLSRYLEENQIWPNDTESLIRMLTLGKLVLFFDGFDELALRTSYSRATEYLETLLQGLALPNTRAKVVVSSRVQHFLNDADLSSGLKQAAQTALGRQLGSIPLGIGRLLPFTDEQITQFLRQQLPRPGEAHARFTLIRSVNNLLGLSHNPRMLSFIVDLPEKDLRAAMDRTGTITASSLYQKIIERWLREQTGRVNQHSIEPGLSYEDRLAAVIRLAIRMWKQSTSKVSIEDLSAEATGLLDNLAVATHQVGAGTLLVRDSEGKFSFLHESIMEWLLAYAAAAELQDGPHGRNHGILTIGVISSQTAEFLIGLVGEARVLAWANRVATATDEELSDE